MQNEMPPYSEQIGQVPNRPEAKSTGLIMFFGGVITGIILLFAAYYLVLATYRLEQDLPEAAVEDVTGAEEEAVTDSTTKTATDQDGQVKTEYKNSKLGFSISYPTSWQLKESTESNNKDAPIISLSGPDTLREIDKAIADRSYYGPLEDLSVYVYENTTTDRLIQDDATIERTGTVDINGVSAAEVIRGGYGSYYAVQIEGNGRVYELFFGNTDNKDTLSEEQIAIRDSFVLIEI